MKDAYSFDTSDATAQESYRKMYDAYTRIFQRCGLKTIPVEADTGVMGGKFSHEFMVPAETGENEVAYCEKCDYAANVEKASSKAEAGTKTEAGLPLEKFATPGVVTIESLSAAPYSVSAERQIKTLVYVVESRVILILVRGDDQLNEAKLAGALGTGTFRTAEPAEIFAAMGAHPGSLGAVASSLKTADIPIYADLRLQDAAGMTTGANENGFHVRNVAIGRDVQVGKWADLRTVKAGEACPNCGAPLKVRRAIEVGHVFKLGTKYSEALNALFLDESGKQQPAYMGCYGIGVTRTLQAVIEQSNDANGIVWPISVAPYTVCITPLSVAPESEVMKRATQIYQELSAQGIDVIIDDRNERPGVKFKDSELVGFPIRVGVGEKSLAKGEVEIKPRGGAMVLVAAGDAVAKVLEMVKG
jgi:prolyl-tRNA synthetase